MSSPITLYLGPAGAGKTAELLARYRARLRESLPGQTLWIAPTYRSAAAVRSQLLDENLPACFDPNVVTFSGFARRVLEANAAQVVPLSDVMKRVLVRRIVSELHAAGRLQHFGPVAEKPGFIDSLVQLISELKRAETWPEDFRKALRAGRRSRKDDELAEIYEAYQALLVDLGMYDAEGCFWSARDLIGRGRRRPFEGVRLVVVDGFTDFTETQYDILKLLATSADAMFISLPLEEPLQRRELFAKASDTLGRLQQRLNPPGVRVEKLSATPGTVPPALAHLERSLFLTMNGDALAGEAEGIEVLEAVGQLGEVRRIAARVKQLLLDGVPADEIVVVFRNLDPYAALVDEVFSQHGIPFALEAGRVLSRVPAVSALVGLVRLVAEDWPFRPLSALLRSNYLRPAWPEWNTETVRATEAVLRRIGIPSGRDEILRGVERLRDREARRLASGDGDEPELRKRVSEADEALALLGRLGDAFNRLPASACPPGEWVEALRGMADDIGFDHALAELHEAVPVDARVAPALDHALDQWAFAETVSCDPPPKLDLRRFVAGLRELLSWQQLAPVGDETGRVRVLSASQCRALRAPYLFVGGMAEKSFPSPRSDDALYSEAERHELNRHGLALAHRRSALQDEMLLFYQVVTRAERRLIFSYPSTDSQGEPLLASAFLEDVLAAFQRDVVPRQRQDQLDPVPAADEVYTPAAARVCAVAESLDGKPQRFARLQGEANLAATCDNVLSAFESAHARVQVREFGPFEGIVLGEHARKAIAKRFGRNFRFNPTQLETYALCPFRFFLSALLGVEELEDPEIGDDLAARGSLAHRTLALLHRMLNEQAAGPCSPAELPPDVLREHFRSALAQATRGEAGTEVGDALAEIEQRLLLEWGESYLEQHHVYEAKLGETVPGLRPAHFEVAFGFSDRRNPEGDALSTDKPFVLRSADEEVRFCGQIDRLDVAEMAGRVVFNVIDYKTGSGSRYTKSRIQTGDSLQLPLYALAAQHVLFEGRDALPAAGGYWFVKEQGFKEVLRMAELADGNLEETPDWANLRETIEGRVGELVRGIRSGQFPVASADGHCTAHCPYHTVCRINQVRSLKKTWEPPREAAKP